MSVNSRMEKYVNCLMILLGMRTVYLRILETLPIKLNKKDRKLLKKIKKMKEGDEIKLHEYDVICFDKEFYILINPYGIYEKHFVEIKDWVIYGGKLD